MTHRHLTNVGLADEPAARDTTNAPHGDLVVEMRAPRIADLNYAGSSTRQLIRMRNVCLFAFVLSIASAAVFIAFINKPVFDDRYNLADVHRYANEGVSAETVRAHVNATGPTGFLWMSVGVRLLPTNELRAARLAVLTSWIVLGLGMLIGARYSSDPRSWYSALLCVLVFPHALTSAATVMTEASALLFASIGILLWIEFIPGCNYLSISAFSGLLVGFAVTCRQYYLALLPAMIVLAIYYGRIGEMQGMKVKSKMVIPIVTAIVPVALMASIWRGLSSPAMAAGASYSTWSSKVGINFSRPLIAALYVLIYLALLTFPVMWGQSRRWPALLLAIATGICAGRFAFFLIEPGPVESLIRLAKRPIWEAVVFAAIVTVAVYNAFCVLDICWNRRYELFGNRYFLLASLVLGLFILEQVGIGGNVPFYDRYVLQVAPFIGIVSFVVLPRMSALRLGAIAVLGMFSHVVLWRYAFAV